MYFGAIYAMGSSSQNKIKKGFKQSLGIVPVNICVRMCCAGYPHNPYNGVICNDVIAASGVFTAKELWKFTKGKRQPM